MKSRALAVLCVLAAIACTNNPYPDADDQLKVRYRYLPEPPKTFDPAISYTRLSHVVMVNFYETLLEYHYLKRPYTLMPGLAKEIPQPRPLADGRVAYRFELREGMLYQDDPAFEALGTAQNSSSTRELVAADIAFEMKRLADRKVNSPIFAVMVKIDGFREFSERLEKLREEDPEFEKLRIDRQYERVGEIPGIRTPNPHSFEVVLSERYPQILYWFAMAFTAPVPWEAIVYYDGEEGRPNFRDHPVGAGPYRVIENNKFSRIVLEKNPNWYGIQHPEWKAPGATYPTEGAPGDAERGRLDPAYVGQPLPFTDRIEYRIEKEDIPRFNKFFQGYYDSSSIINESFEQVVHEGGLSEEMQSMDMRLDKAVDPDVFYIGFNLDDPVVGTPAGDRSRALRQAMSLAVDVDEYSRIFLNGRGVPAHSPVPPGIFGYDAEYRNPYRAVDLERARRLMVEAGYPDGVDPQTGKALKLTLDAGDTSTRGRVRYQYYVDSWSPLGIDVEIEATNYNQYRAKMRSGAYQIHLSGWIADYPDPENFLFLLWGENAQSVSNGENHANFKHPRFDALFLRMKDMENGPERMAIIDKMRAILETERPWIELYHRESYALYHGWVRNMKTAGLTYPQEKYRDVDIEMRAQRRGEWNDPVLWPAYTLAGIGVVIVVPGIATFFRERQ
jgi:ABC-type transport system substrate-binding protein